MLKKKVQENFLDYIPLRNPDFSWQEENGTVTVDMVHRGLFHFAAQKLFHRPRISHIVLDDFGSFLWQRMDGATDVEGLAQALKAEFGDRAEPLYPRLVQYMQTLHNNGFIRFIRASGSS